jgi:hypothetical protein
MEPQVKIDTSPLILFPIVAERKTAIIDRALKGEV